MLARSALVLAVLGCSGPSLPASAPASCPIATRADPERAARLEARLVTAPEGLALRDGWLGGVRAICFGEGELSVVTHDHVIRLDARLSDAEAAARLGHLLVHERDGHPMGEQVTAESDCPALVHEALTRESRAYALEARLRRALGVTDPLMAFEIEAETAGLSDEEASARWLAYLEAHPGGAPGIDALGSGYLAQCERDRAALR